MSKTLDLNKPTLSAPHQHPVVTWGGAVLLQIGAISLLVQFAVQGHIANWWAVFILAPALIALNIAWIGYAKSKSFTGLSTRIGLGVGAIVMTVALLFLLDLDWGAWWPAMIIVPCTTVFANSLTGSKDKFGPITRSVLSQIAWISGSATLLGVVFLVGELSIIDLHQRFGAFQWWGVFILLPGLSALLNAVILYQHNSPSTKLATIVFLGLGTLTCATAGVALLGLDWHLLNVLTAFILIGIGLLLLTGQLITRSQRPR